MGSVGSWPAALTSTHWMLVAISPSQPWSLKMSPDIASVSWGAMLFPPGENHYSRPNHPYLLLLTSLPGSQDCHLTFHRLHTRLIFQKILPFSCLKHFRIPQHLSYTNTHTHNHPHIYNKIQNPYPDLKGSLKYFPWLPILLNISWLSSWPLNSAPSALCFSTCQSHIYIRTLTLARMLSTILCMADSSKLCPQSEISWPSK